MLFMPGQAARCTPATVVLVTLLLACLVWITSRPGWNTGDSFAVGCDSFGYQRGAELIRKSGPIKGLRTIVKDPDASLLIEAAKATGKPASAWAEAVAPHCHHYDTGSDAVIMQYPPGTSLLMSMFPRGTGGQNTFTVTIGLICLTILSIVLIWSPSFAGLGMLSLMIVGVLQMMTLGSTMSSFSVPWSLALAPVAALLSVLVEDARGRSALFLGAGLGLVCAFSILIRIPNIFLVEGVAIFLALRCRSWSLKGLRRHGTMLLATSSTFLLYGPALLAWYQWINTGSPLHTTYGPSDASGPILSWDLITSHVVFYFYDTETARFIDLSFIIVLISLSYSATKQLDRRIHHVNIAALACILTSVAFFLTHTITAPYYLLPVATFVVAMVVFAHLRSGFGDCLANVGSRWLPLATLTGLVLLITISIDWKNEPPPHSMSIPSEVLSRDAIVWADIYSGSLFYYNKKYAAKLPFAFDLCARAALIKQVSLRGRKQYFILDSDAMHKIIDDLQESGSTLSMIGLYEATDPLQIMQLDHYAGMPEACSAG